MSTPYVQTVNTNILGEGPHWRASTGDLYYVDIGRNAVHRYNPATGQNTKVNIGGAWGVSLVIPVEGENNRFVISNGHDLQFMVWDGISPEPTSLTTFASVEPEYPQARWNDGKCDSMGRLFAGTSSETGQPTGALYRITQGEVSRMVAGITISNGIAWNSANTLMYYIDTPTRRVDVFDYDIATGNITNRRPLYDFAAMGENGDPDGMTIDANGNLIVGCWGGSKMIHINPVTGQKIRSVNFPTSNITSGAFAGPNLSTLYVTSANVGLSEIELNSQPAAGSLFQVTNLGVTGQAVGNAYRP
ncbi:regucalcin [Folsomia candida]|uniref:regucalcin n=1 Tax=Folsomia candida TaxID=158441 RepID=UPI000B8F26B7|nr:regucalcin [Folsomia candida]